MYKKIFKNCIDKKFTIFEVFKNGGNIRQINNASLVSVDKLNNSARLVTPLLYKKCAPCYITVDLTKGEANDSNVSIIFLDMEKAKRYSIDIKLFEIQNITKEIRNISDNLIEVLK